MNVIQKLIRAICTGSKSMYALHIMERVVDSQHFTNYVESNKERIGRTQIEWKE
jgi:hypothetical protein